MKSFSRNSSIFLLKKTKHISIIPLVFQYWSCKTRRSKFGKSGTRKYFRHTPTYGFKSSLETYKFRKIYKVLFLWENASHLY